MVLGQAPFKGGGWRGKVDRTHTPKKGGVDRTDVSPYFLVGRVMY